MREFKTLQELAAVKTKTEIVDWASLEGVCPVDLGCNCCVKDCAEGENEEQCSMCWLTALADVQCVGDVQPTELIAPVNQAKMLAHMDNLVEEIKNLQAQIDNWDEQLTIKIQEATAKVNAEKEKLQKAIDYNKAQLEVAFNNAEYKETKTQKKIKCISGDIIVKKAAQKIECDKDKLLTYVKENKLDEFVETNETFKWGEFKKTLTVTGDNIVDSDGIVLDIDGLTIVTTDEKLEVK